MKHASRLLSLLVLTAAFVLLAGSSCQKSIPERAWERGQFQRMDQNAENYSLPSGITIDSMNGYPDAIYTSDEPLAIYVTNSKTSDVKVTFPAGLVFSCSSSPDYEFMMLLKDFSFTAVAGGTTFDTLPTFGCNEESLDAPDDVSFYEIGWRENDKDIQELLDLVANKTLTDSLDALTLAQDALSEITDDSGLTADTKAALQNLP